MKLHGSLQANLEAALLSARRLRGQRVYPDTLAYWIALAAAAWSEVAASSGPQSSILTRLAADLDIEIAAHRDVADKAL